MVVHSPIHISMVCFQGRKKIKWLNDSFKYFLSQFYDSAVVPDTEVKPEIPSAGAISDNIIETEEEEENEEEEEDEDEERTEPEKDVLAQSNKYELEFLYNWRENLIF